MKRREFVKGAMYSSLFTALPLRSAIGHTTSVNHPQVINVIPDGPSLSIPLQTALQQAYDLWISDPQERRPLIELPTGDYIVDDIASNNRGNYPFRLPPTFKLTGQGKGLTNITCVQPHGSQYRFIMTRPQTRIDIIAACPTLETTCVEQNTLTLGSAFDIEISGISFIDFDNAIGFVNTENCIVKDCDFVGSLVGVQLTRGDLFGNKGAQFIRCDFNSMRTNGDKLSFGLRFETPFYANWMKQVENIANEEECLARGVGAVNYDNATLECEVVDAQDVIDYLDEFFGNDYNQDISNTQCLVSECNFTNASYSAIEFAGTLNTFNTVELCNFTNCDGTAIEFDKGASHNTAYKNTISGMRPTTVFAPSVPYIFQASIQEQEGSYTADQQLNEVIIAYGLADINNSNFKGGDIFERAALLPVGNQIIENKFDVSRSYQLSEFEPDDSKHQNLPDIYPSIKIRKSYKTKVNDNEEFIGDLNNVVTDTSVIGQSILIYPGDTLRNERGDVEISGNRMHGALYIQSASDEISFNLPVVIENNEFGNQYASHRGGIIINGCIAESIELNNNKFYCSNDGSSISIKAVSINNLTFDGNEFYIQEGNSFYLRCSDAEQGSSRTLNFTNNLIEGGVAMTIYDWTSPSTTSSDILNFSDNHIKNFSGTAKVVGITLWYKNLLITDNQFDSFEDKTFQFYGLSDVIQYTPKNTLYLDSSSQSRAYSRNYANTAGTYVTADFWN